MGGPFLELKDTIFGTDTCHIWSYRMPYLELPRALAGAGG